MRVYDYITEYRIAATLLAPLHTGDIAGECDMILFDSEKNAMIQGNSLAGAMRAYAEKNYPEEVASIFGSQENEGSIIVSDGIFSKGSVTGTRPRLRINKATGAADKGAKFDTLHIESGSAFDFSITWFGTKACIGETKIIEDILAALNEGVITLGAYKSTGYGRVSLSVKKCEFYLKEEKARNSWLKDEFAGREVILPKAKNAEEVIFKVKGKLPNILVGSGAPKYVDKNGKTTAIKANITENGIPIIPGSSIKGSVRNRVEMIEAYKGLSGISTWMFGNSSEKSDQHECGRIIFEDCRLEGKAQTVTRIRINKFTGGVFSGAMIKEEPLSSDVEIIIRSKNNDKANGLLIYALRDLGLGLYGFGSGNSIGRGRVNVSEIDVVSGELEAKLVFDNERNITKQDDNGIFDAWISSLEA